MGTKNYRVGRLVRVAFFVPLLLVLFSTGRRVVTAAQPSDYRLLNKVTLGGEGGWDYLAMDPSSRYEYTNSGGIRAGRKGLNGIVELCFS